jgi:hypothetical protein
MRALFGGGQFLDLVTEVRLVPVPPRGVGKDGAAIVFPTLDFDLASGRGSAPSGPHGSSSR